jgi:hypothetical protein
MLFHNPYIFRRKSKIGVFMNTGPDVREICAFQHTWLLLIKRKLIIILLRLRGGTGLKF